MASSFNRDKPVEESTEDPSSAPNLQKGDDLRRSLEEAGRDLQSIQMLLLNPHPDHMRRVEQIVEQAAARIRLLEREYGEGLFDADACCAEGLALQTVLRRILALVHGAQRIYWHRMRRMGSYIETYTANGKTTVSVYRPPNLDCKI